ncbi:MAG: DUF6133 family protein [Clostridia bacterium]
MNKTINKIKSKFLNKLAEGYINSGIKILIAVVVGAVLLGGLIYLIKGNILPTTKNRISDISNMKTTGGPPYEDFKKDKWRDKIELVSLTTPNARLVRGEKAKFIATIKNNSDYAITANENFQLEFEICGVFNNGSVPFVLDVQEEKTFEIEGTIPLDLFDNVSDNIPFGIIDIKTPYHCEIHDWIFLKGYSRFIVLPHLPPIE